MTVLILTRSKMSVFIKRNDRKKVILQHVRKNRQAIKRQQHYTL